MSKKTLVKDFNRMRSILWDLREEPFAFDLETSGLDERKDRILGLALTLANGESYYFCIEHTVEKDGEISNRLFMDRDDFRNAIAPLFAQKDILMVAHNAKFDLKFLHKAGISVEGRLYDTMLASHVLDENRESHSLKALAGLVGIDMTKYLDMVHYPGFAKEEILGVPLDQVAEYAQLDTQATWLLYKKFSVEIAREDLEPIFNKVVMPLLPVLAQMEARGVAIDVPKVRELREQYLAKANEYEAKVQAEGIKMLLSMPVEELPKECLRMLTEEEEENIYVKDDGSTWVTSGELELPVIRPTPRSKNRVPVFNPNSNTQLPKLLFEYYGLKPPEGFRMKTKADGSNSADKNMLTTLGFTLGEDAPPALKDILAMRKASKFVSTYLDRFIADADPEDDNSLRTTLNQHVTATGRLSSSNPNLLNISARGQEGKDARGVFIARPGHKLIVGDFASFELRLLAHYSKEPKLIKAFTEGLDLHTMTAADQTNRTYEEMKAILDTDDLNAKKARHVGKTSNFGLTYGMGAKKFQIYLLVEAGIHVSLKEAERLIEAFRASWPVAEEWKVRAVRHAKKLGYIKTIGGRKRRLPELYSNDRYTVMRAERQAVNAIIQGSCGDLIAMTMPPIQNAIAPFGGSILLQIYDELVLEAPTQHAELCARLTEDIIRGMLNPLLSVPLEFDANVGDSWLEAK